jgi:menaquinone-dependent protoporphyrinogen oxidase
MDAKKVLIAYSTKSGATAESANLIAEVLREKHHLVVDVVDLKQQGKPDIGPYGAVIIGGGIRIGMWYGRARRMLRRDYGDRRVAVFLSSGRAGDPKQHHMAVERYLRRVLAKRPKIQHGGGRGLRGWMMVGGQVW